MHVKSIAELEHSAILLTFIKLPVVIKIFVLSIFEWLFYTGFTVGIKFYSGPLQLWGLTLNEVTTFHLNFCIEIYIATG